MPFVDKHIITSTLDVYMTLWAWLGLLSQTLSALTLETASSCCHQNLYPLRLLKAHLYPP